MNPFKKGSIDGQCYWIQLRRLVQCTREFDHTTAVRAKLREGISQTLATSPKSLARKVGCILEKFSHRDCAGNITALRRELMEIPWAQLRMVNSKLSDDELIITHKRIALDPIFRMVYFVKSEANVSYDTAKFATGFEDPSRALINRRTHTVADLMSFAEAEYGWIRVHGQFISCCQWDDSALRRLRKGLRQICERHAVIAESLNWHITTVRPRRRNYFDIPLFELNHASELLRMDSRVRARNTDLE